MALELSGSINISGSMTATTIIVSAPGAPGMVSSSNQLVELNTATGSLIGITNGLMGVTASLNLKTGSLATTGSNTLIGEQTISGSLNIGSSVSVQNGSTLRIYRTDNTRALQLYTTNDECVIDSWEASAEPLHIRSMGAGGRIQFFTSGSEKLRITPDGYQRMATGTKGIQFNGDTAAANALNDYEEGTFTPAVVYSTTNTPSFYGSGQLGRYTKVGRIVQVQIYLNWNENGSTGNISISGLPFTSPNSQPRATASIFSFGFVGLSSSIVGFVNPNSTTLGIFINDNSGTSLTEANTDTDQDLYITVIYEVV
jgi:hypothetical protein